MTEENCSLIIFIFFNNFNFKYLNGILHGLTIVAIHRDIKIKTDDVIYGIFKRSRKLDLVL